MSGDLSQEEMREIKTAKNREKRWRKKMSGKIPAPRWRKRKEQILAKLTAKLHEVSGGK